MPEIVLKSFGREVRKQRMARHLSQEKLAESIGISSKHLANIEKGKVNPSLDTATMIIRELHISMDNIIYQDELETMDQFMNQLRVRLPQYSNRSIDLLHTIIELVDLQEDRFR